MTTGQAWVHRVDCESLVMQLAQEIVALNNERNVYRSRLENWDWRGLLRDARKGDFDSIVSALVDVVAMEDERTGPDPEMEKP